MEAICICPTLLFDMKFNTFIAVLVLLLHKESFKWKYHNSYAIKALYLLLATEFHLIY